MREPPCPRCKRPYPEGWTKAMRTRQSVAIKAALAKADRVGRKRAVDYGKIWGMIDIGLSQGQAAKQLGVSRGCIQHALRRRKHVYA